MLRYFIPYVKDAPASVDVNGHKLLLLRTDDEGIEIDLAFLGGDSVRSLEVQEDPQELNQALAKLADSIKGGVVLTPPGVSAAVMIKNLEKELPWIH